MQKGCKRDAKGMQKGYKRDARDISSNPEKGWEAGEAALCQAAAQGRRVQQDQWLTRVHGQHAVSWLGVQAGFGSWAEKQRNLLSRWFALGEPNCLDGAESCHSVAATTRGKSVAATTRGKSVAATTRGKSVAATTRG
eukprot:228265-Chlamydomonas_euryale.AAC.1